MKVNSEFDIAIIGAGPAGIAAAISIPPSYTVIQFEKSNYPVKKLCGGLLTQDALRHVSILTGLNKLPDSIKCSPVTQILRSVDFDCGMTTVIDVGYDNIDRNKFDAWLSSYINRTNYKLEYSTKVVDIKKSNGGFIIDAVKADTVTQYRAQIIIDCSGWVYISGKIKNKAKLARRFALQFSIPNEINHSQEKNAGTDFKNPNLNQEYRAYFFKQITDWFGWTIPKDKELVVGIGFQRNGECALETKYSNRSNDSALSRSYNEAEIPITSRFIQFIQHLNEKGFIKLDRIPDYMDAEAVKSFFSENSVKGCPITSLTSIKQVYLGDNNIFVLGEAAGLVSPSSGDGISYALSSGMAVGKVLERVLTKNKRNGRSIDQDDQRLYADLLAYETRELRFNVQKAKMLSNPKMRNAALWFLSWHNGKSMERLH
jgi:geranylgeranyl diphosphate/geranylgeranyl-bacteriochlorophyllide a reductase